MKYAGFTALLALTLSPVTTAQSITLTPGEWTHTRSTAERGAPRIETRSICLSSQDAETDLIALATAFNESLFCEAEDVTPSDHGASFSMVCGPISMFRHGEGEVSVETSNSYTIIARARLNVPGSAQIISTITETATHTGPC